MNIKFSIITIVYNSISNIERTIQSVLGQNYDNFEYIIIDGGSKDGTKDIILKYENQLKYWVSEKDNGISDAFNKGIGRATGDYIGLLNAGDIYTENILSNLNEYILKAKKSNNQFNIFHGNIQMGIEKGKIYKPFDLQTFKSQMPIWHPTIFASNTCYSSLKYDINFKIAMDYDLFSKLYKMNANFNYIDILVTIMDLDGVSNFNAIRGFKEVMIASNKNLNVNRLISYINFIYKCLIFKFRIYYKCLA